jgi:phosphopantetheinyl transferase
MNEEEKHQRQLQWRRSYNERHRERINAQKRLNRQRLREQMKEYKSEVVITPGPWFIPEDD